MAAQLQSCFQFVLLASLTAVCHSMNSPSIKSQTAYDSYASWMETVSKDTIALQKSIGQYMKDWGSTDNDFDKFEGSGSRGALHTSTSQAVTIIVDWEETILGELSRSQWKAMKRKLNDQIKGLEVAAEGKDRHKMTTESWNSLGLAEGVLINMRLDDELKNLKELDNIMNNRQPSTLNMIKWSGGKQLKNLATILKSEEFYLQPIQTSKMKRLELSRKILLLTLQGLKKLKEAGLTVGGIDSFNVYSRFDNLDAPDVLGAEIRSYGFVRSDSTLEPDPREKWRADKNTWKKSSSGELWKRDLTLLGWTLASFVDGDEIHHHDYDATQPNKFGQQWFANLWAEIKKHNRHQDKKRYKAVFATLKEMIFYANVPSPSKLISILNPSRTVRQNRLSPLISAGTNFFFGKRQDAATGVGR